MFKKEIANINFKYWLKVKLMSNENIKCRLSNISSTLSVISDDVINPEGGMNDMIIHKALELVIECIDILDNEIEI